MIAIDTNVVVRLLVGDDLHQTEVARRRVREGAFVSHGVLMEAEWVMRTAYSLPRDYIADSLLDLLALEPVMIEQRERLLWAVDRYRSGADWSDLLHLIAARGQGGFATFDRALPRQAGKEAPVAIEVLK